MATTTTTSSSVTASQSSDTSVADTLGRPLRDIRISVTDRCNFRCLYCMPKEVFGRDYAFLPREDLLSFEEITRLTSIAVANGVEKVRLTGGEPLLRKGLPTLIEMLGELKTPDGRMLDIALTTNGSALARMAPALKAAGLARVTVSLDSTDDTTFQAMNDVRFPVAKVLAGLDAAHQAGLGPIKVNMVVQKGRNDQDIVKMARHFKGTPFILRFIEYMDVGTTNGWNLGEVVPSAEVISRINAELPLEQLPPNYPGETSARWRYRDGEGEIGVISSVTQSFCHSCTRARVSAEGMLYTCLFATSGHDLRALIRSGCSDEELEAALRSLWAARSDRYSQLRSDSTGNHSTGNETTESENPDAPRQRTSGAKRVEMSYIGG